MNYTEHVQVEIQGDFIAKQTRAEPLVALSELIWNGLDGEATDISVEFENNDLAGGLSKIVVYDNGEGFPRSEAKTLFGSLGGSWKRLSRLTKTKGRLVHGQEGRGRYKAFALGSAISWNVCYLKSGAPYSFKVSIKESDLTDVAIEDEKPSPDRSNGVVVEITGIKRDFKSFTSEKGLQELTEIFALYLINYKDVSIRIGGTNLLPEKAIITQKSFPLPPIKDEIGMQHEVELQLIEWGTDSKRVMYLCSDNGFPLEQLETRFQIPGFSFTAYLRSSYFAQSHNDGRLGLTEMSEVGRDTIDAARNTVKQYFRERLAEQAQNVVEEWKSADIYPYEGEAKSPIEKAERQVFDIVAVNVQEFAPDIVSAAPKTRAFYLRMLRHAIESGPNDLQMIIKEVLQLPERKQKELAGLLQETTLSAIITASKTVADRLKFIAALESIVFDPETKNRLKERTQLHKILAENTWIFGEEFNLWASDKGLKAVLEKHRAILDPSIVIDDPIPIVGKKRGIIDLMLSRSTRRHRSDDIEHLVVELKAPKVKVSADAITQANKYAIAVSRDERFQGVKGVRWNFWVISNAYDDYADSMIQGGPDPQRKLIFKNSNVSVGIKTWGELIEENKARLQFFQEHLEYTADEDVAVKYLQEKHSEYLKGVVEVEDGEETLSVPDKSGE